VRFFGHSRKDFETLNMFFVQTCIATAFPAIKQKLNRQAAGCGVHRGALAWIMGDGDGTDRDKDRIAQLDAARLGDRTGIDGDRVVAGRTRR